MTVGGVRCQFEMASWSQWMGQALPDFKSFRAEAMPMGRIGFSAFDLLQQGSRCPGKKPLPERRAWLEEVLGRSAVKLSPALDGTADQVVKAVREHRLSTSAVRRQNAAGTRRQVGLGSASRACRCRS
jgi:hypothetical protein